MTEEILNASLTKYLKDSHGYLYSYFVPTETLTYSKQVDICAMNPSEMG